MSVVKSKRNKSKVEFEMLYFKVAGNIDDMVETCFYVKPEMLDANKVFLATRCRSIEVFSDRLLYYIKIANSIYPQCLAELEERRISMDKAIGICFAILTTYQRVMMRLKVRDDKYNHHITDVMQLINSLKAWRKSDNRLKDKLTQ